MTPTLVAQLANQHKDLTKPQIEGILYLILTQTSLTLSSLVRITGLPKTVLADVLKSLAPLLHADATTIYFTEAAREQLLAAHLVPYSWTLGSFDVHELDAKHAALRQKYAFSQKREFDQFFATSLASIKKALAIQAKAGIKGTKIALLGDDDLLSFAIPLLAQDYAEIVVFDIDQEQLSKIQQAAEAEGFSRIKTQLYDARSAIPQKYRNYFDIVFSDPPYTKDGFDLFLDRSVELARISKDYDGSYIYICYGIGLKNIEREVKLLDSIYSRNLYLEDKLFKFNKYEGAETVGSSSSLYILKTTPFTHIPQSVVAENIYTFENVKEEKFPFVDHYVFKVHGVDPAYLKSKAKLTAVFGEFCTKHKLNVMNTYFTHFKPYGFSLTYILANSNLVVHTWEEYAAVHVDLITCSPIHNASLLSANLKALLKARSIDYYKVS